MRTYATKINTRPDGTVEVHRFVVNGTDCAVLYISKAMQRPAVLKKQPGLMLVDVPEFTIVNPAQRSA